jgi:hypothetical protein
MERSLPGPAPGPPPANVSCCRGLSARSLAVSSINAGSALAAPAGVFRPARLDHTQLGRHHVKALGNVLPDDVQRAAAALTSLVLWFDPRTRAGLTSDAGWRGTIIFQVRERIGEGALATAVGLAGGFAGSTLGPVAALASQRCVRAYAARTFPAFEKLAAHRDWLTCQDRERG